MKFSILLRIESSKNEIHQVEWANSHTWIIYKWSHESTTTNTSSKFGVKLVLQDYKSLKVFPIPCSWSLPSDDHLSKVFFPTLLFHLDSLSKKHFSFTHICLQVLLSSFIFLILEYYLKRILSFRMVAIIMIYIGFK